MNTEELRIVGENRYFIISWKTEIEPELVDYVKRERSCSGTKHKKLPKPDNGIRERLPENMLLLVVETECERTKSRTRARRRRVEERGVDTSEIAGVRLERR